MPSPAAAAKFAKVETEMMHAAARDASQREHAVVRVI
jgi:hypothetical protein